MDLTGASDDQLVTLARSGDATAFGRLVERHYDFVYRVAFRWCGRRPDAEDIAQDVCVRLGKTIAGYRGAGAFTTWLYALTLNAARDLRRRSAREDAKGAAFRLHAVAIEAVLEDPAADDPAKDLWEAVRQLPEKQRAAILLVYGEGLAHAAAAEILSVSEATVSWHVHEAKKRLRVLMAQAREIAS